MNEKPNHNMFDNIWEIRNSGYPSERQIEEVLSKRYYSRETKHIGKAIVYYDVVTFIRSVLSAKSVKLPVWKIICPQLDYKTGEILNTGAIYYVACTDVFNHIFRGTYGYRGTGPHESALVETVFEKYNMFFEVRGPDYLLSFLE